MGNDEADKQPNDEPSDIQKYRDYAAECRRMAQRASEKDRQVLMEIADAWNARAEEVERRSKPNRKDS